MGTRSIDRGGYVILRGKEFGGAVREHRWLMEQHLGRKLLPNEVVHHVNQVRHDNRLENLQVMEWGIHTRDHGHIATLNRLRFPNVANGRWAENFDACTQCGKDDKPHASNGVCFRCYDRAYQKRKRLEAGAIPSKVRREVWSVDWDGNIYYACLDCGRSTTRPGARGRCQTCVRWLKKHGDAPRKRPLADSPRRKHDFSPGAPHPYR